MPRQTIGGRYELEQPLGGGAMSAVWLARDNELERQVAVKLLAHDADRARFEREAHAVAALADPHICQLYDYGETDDGPYMVLEYLPGGTLEDRLAAGRPLPDAETARIAQEVAAGLAHAHERGLVHRDLKPANILFDAEGRAKIADFGIARVEGGRELTVAGTVLGTAAYLSPEQAAGLPATAASDVYSFGVILFRLLTGRTPFVSDNAMELVRMHQHEPPPRVEDVRADAPPALAGLAAAALAKEPGGRPQDGSALLAALAGTDASATAPAAVAETQLLASVAPAADATQVIPRAPRRRRRLAALLVAAAVAVLALGGAAAAFLLTGSDGDAADTTVPSLSLPSVGAETTSGSTTTTAPTTAPVLPPPETTSTTPTTSSTPGTTSTAPPTSSTRPTTTRRTTTAPLPSPPPEPATTSTQATTTTAPTTTATTTATTTTATATTTAFVPPGQTRQSATTTTTP